MYLTSNFKVEDLGVQEQVVYDLETENHMFFGNYMLLHNSNYMDMTDVLNLLYEDNPDADLNEATDFLDGYGKRIESECLTPAFEKVKYECNCNPEGNLHMDREAICVPYKKTGYSAIWTAKKRYIAMVSDMEDFRYDTPHRKIMGMFSVTSTCPEFIKPVYNEVLENLIRDGDDVARATIKNFKKVFFEKSIAEIAFPKSVSDVTKYMDAKTGLPYTGEWYDVDSEKTRNGGVPINAKAAIYYNYLLKKLGLDKKYQFIKDGDKMKYVYLLPNKYDFSVMGFIDDFPEEFEMNKHVDYNTHWEKLFYSPINDIFTACGITIEKTFSIADFF